jgi:hypothetical protein
MWMVTCLEENIVRKAKLIPKETVQQALDDAVSTVKAKGMDPRLVIMPAGSLTVPYIEGGV